MCGRSRNSGFLSGKGSDAQTEMTIRSSSIAGKVATLNFTRPLNTTSTKAMNLVTGNGTDYLIAFGAGQWNKDQTRWQNTGYNHKNNVLKKFKFPILAAPKAAIKLGAAASTIVAAVGSLY
mgnify:CR=1 FL=1